MYSSFPSPPAILLSDPIGELTAGCTRIVLHCSNRTVREESVVFLDPLFPLSAPSVQCPSRSVATLVVFSGRECALWRPGNVMDCFWNVSTQAR